MIYLNNIYIYLYIITNKKYKFFKIITLKVSKNEIDYLNKNFYQLAGSNEKIDRTRFRDLLTDDFEIDDSLLMDRGRYY